MSLPQSEFCTSKEQLDTEKVYPDFAERANLNEDPKLKSVGVLREDVLCW